MTHENLTEIVRVITDEHAQDVGRWQSDCPAASPLGLALMKYMDSQFEFLKDLRLWIDEGKIPEGK